MTQQYLSGITLLVADYDEAIQFYTESLGFTLVEDVALTAEKRWVKVAPPGAQTALLLALASNEQQQQLVGSQAGGRVLLFLQTDDFWQDYQKMQARGVQFLEPPREESYAIVAVFADLYGNKWDLIQPKLPADKS